jgi:hypothetical protein
MTPFAENLQIDATTTPRPLRTFAVWQVIQYSDDVLTLYDTELIPFREGEIVLEPDPVIQLEIGTDIDEDVEVVEKCLGVVDAFRPNEACLWAAKKYCWKTVSDLIASVELCPGIACWLEAREID